MKKHFVKDLSSRCPIEQPVNKVLLFLIVQRVLSTFGQRGGGGGGRIVEFIFDMFF